MERKRTNTIYHIKGNQKNVHIKASNKWKRGKLWIKVSGTWKRAVTWKNINGTWKRGG